MTPILRVVARGRIAGPVLAQLGAARPRMSEPRGTMHEDGAVRVAVTLEQCWHRVPGGTGIAALETVGELARYPDRVELIGVAGSHAEPPPSDWAPPIEVRQLASSGARLYASWLWLGRPGVERATGPVDVAHATSIIPCPTKAPLVVTVHDLAFLHEPDHFTRWGRAVFARSLSVIRRRAALVLCSSQATVDDCLYAGLPAERLRLVPLGVRAAVEVLAADHRRVVDVYGLPERFVLAVGTVEPRKNLARLAVAVGRLDEPLPLIIAGAAGWGDGAPAADSGADVRFLGFVPSADLPALYGAATVVAVPSLREGFGLPVAEAMSHGAPVVTSRGTSTEEVAGGAAVLIDPLDVDDIAGGITRAISERGLLAEAGRRRAAELTWSHTAELTLAAYREVAR